MTKIDTVRYIGETSPLELTNGKIYKVLSVERGWYRVVDDTGEDYLYPAGWGCSRRSRWRRRSR